MVTEIAVLLFATIAVSTATRKRIRIQEGPSNLSDFRLLFFPMDIRVEGVKRVNDQIREFTTHIQIGAFQISYLPTFFDL
jgi:hypothetical protein